MTAAWPVLGPLSLAGSALLTDILDAIFASPPCDDTVPFSGWTVLSGSAIGVDVNPLDRRLYPCAYATLRVNECSGLKIFQPAGRRFDRVNEGQKRIATT